MKSVTGLTLGCLISLISPAFAQHLTGGSIPMNALGAMPVGGGWPVSDAASEMNTYITAISDAAGGMFGGFDPTMALATDLQQQVASTGGLSLSNQIPGTFQTLWPGYSNGSYNQARVPGSPEGDMATTLATLQGTLQAAADQQNGQAAELARLQTLEAENAAAGGVLQALQVGNEIGLFAAEQEIKLRNATNAQLNALVVAESNRQNKQAQDELQSLAIEGQHSDWNLGDGAMDEHDPQIPNP
jgi:hypothetical protein